MSNGIEVQVLSRYRLVNGEYWPSIWQDHPPVSGSDRTGVQPPVVPDAVVVACVYDLAGLTAVLADPEYGETAVLWIDDGGGRTPDGVMETAEFLALRARLAADGWRTAEIDGALGVAVNGRRRRIVAAGLIDWLRAVGSG